MRKKLLLLLALFLCSAVSGWAWWRPAQRFEVSELALGELRLVTWNVGYFAPVNNKNAKDLDMERIAAVLQPLQAQVVVLQELNSVQQAEEIARKLGSDWYAKTVETGHDQILAVLSSLSGAEMETRTAGGRSMIGVCFQGEDDRDVFILGVHSPHPARGMDATVDNIKAAVSWMCERNEAIRIMAGDLNYNFDPDLTVDGDVLYGEVMSVLSDGTISIGETYYAHTRIDHVFHHPQAMKVMEQSSGMVDLAPRFAKVPGWRDHRPVVTTYDVGEL
ncbi:MAG: hypothetical protein QM496_12965 [Verrucomicrobiota bacterium]